MTFYQCLYIDGPYINNLYVRVGSNSENVYILLKSPFSLLKGISQSKNTWL